MLPLTLLLANANPTTITLDLAKPGVVVSPLLYGQMTEEINYSYDGGLYGELLHNRAFLDDPKAAAHWTAVGDGSSIALEHSGPTAARPVALRLKGGVANDGFWGIPVRPSTSYTLTLWAKADSSKPLKASLESLDGSTVYAQTNVKGIGGNWSKLKTTLKTMGGFAPTKGARLVLRADGSQTAWLSQASLFPPTYKNRPNGNRPDLMQALVDMRPKFLRFPGGNYLEGNTPAERFPWKQTLGPIEGRPGHKCPWGYRSSDGMGLLEFLLWCEDMKAKPLLGIYAGYALNGQFIKAGPALQPLVQDALDEIEYVIGGPETKWGAQRIADGHPKPFALEYVEIGNEDGFDKSGSYEGRFVQFYDAIKAKYPKLKVISSTGGKDWLGQKFPITQRTPDAWDEHYYSESWDMMGMATRYDDYDRKGPKVFVGEWASHDTVAPWVAGSQSGPTPNMKCTIADAAFMTGLERNSDIVAMACYAPLLVNVNPGGRQWSLNLIGYDALTTFGSPSYYAQRMFAENLGNRTVPLTISDAPSQTKDGKTLPGVFASATRKGKQIFLKIVNPLATAQDVSIDLKSTQLAAEGTMIVLSGDLKAVNTLDHPTAVAPVETKIAGLRSAFRQTLAPYSVTVLRLNTK